MDNGLGREFYIQQFRTRNPLRYVHVLRGLVFATEEECEQAIIERLKVTHGLYIDLDGNRRIGIKGYRYRDGE